MLPLAEPNLKSDHDLAMKALSERRFEDAMRGFRAAIAADPKNAEARFHMGRLMIAGDRSFKAIQHLSAAAALRPGYGPGWQVWAEAVALGGSEEDEAEFLAALRKAPVPPKLRIALQDRFGALRRSSRPQMGGVDPRQAAQLAGLMQAKRYPEAEASAKRLLAAHPQSAFVMNVLAGAQASQKNFTAARATYLQAIRTDQRYAEAYENLGRTLLDMGEDGEAGKALRKAVIFAPGLISSLIPLADLLVRTNEARAALPLIDRAVRENPDNVQALMVQGSALTRQNHFEDAAVPYRRVLEIVGDKMSSEARVTIGMAFSRAGKDDEALVLLDAALSQKPDSTIALRGKSSLMQQLGDFDAAQNLAEEVIRLNPADGENWRLMFTSRKVKADDPLLAELRRQYERPDLSDDDRMNMAFALGKALEDVKDYDNVFQHLKTANDLMRKSLPYSIQRRYRDVAWHKEAFREYDFLGTRLEGTSDFAPIFVTGMPRSGTTLIEQIIASHSTVAGAGELSKGSIEAHKLLNPNGRQRKLIDAPTSEIVQLGHAYSDFVRAMHPEAPRVTDKAINTYMNLGLIRLAIPNARIVVVRRDPRDNLLSIYKNKFPEGTHPYAYDLRDLGLFYATFVEMVDYWREKTPGWFYEVQYEELVANPEVEARKLIAACDLEWEDQCLRFHENERKVQTLSLYQVRQPISGGSVKGWKRFEKDLEPMIQALRENGHVPD